VLLLCIALGSEQFLTEPSPWVIRSGGTPLWAQLVLTVTVVGGSVVPIKYMGVAWSLALEEHIYFVYTLILRFIRRLRPLRLLVLALAVSIIWGIGVQAITRSVPPYQFLDQNDASLVARVFFAQLPARGFEWVLGLVAAEVFVGAVRLPRLLRRIEVGLLLIAVGGVLLRAPILSASLNGHRFFVSDVLLNQLFGLAFFIILNAAVHWEQTRAVGRRPTLRLLAGLGLASYSLYLLHPALLVMLDPFVPRHGNSRVVGIAAMWLVILGASYVFYLAAERPFVARSRNVGRGRPAGRHLRKRWRLLKQLS
jgi:peptidoglycan/LPS O-acetylase OafA/YrhL